MNIIDYAISHSRVILGILVFILVAGSTAYINIPKEYKDVQDIKSYDILNNVINNKKYW